MLPLSFELTNNIEKADVVVFGGGKDVDPGFYGEKKGLRTDSPSARDRREKADFVMTQLMRKQGKDIKSVGHCRGGQLLCALSGGKLIQDTTNHFGNHEMTTFDKQSLMVNSIHHQMMYPYNLESNQYKILGWSTNNLSSKYLNGHDHPCWLPNAFKELEVVYFTGTASLAFQFHPEMMYSRGSSDITVKWYQNLFLDFVNNKL